MSDAPSSTSAQYKYRAHGYRLDAGWYKGVYRTCNAPCATIRWFKSCRFTRGVTHFLRVRQVAYI